MKLILAYIRPVKRDEVVQRLRRMSVPGASLSPVNGFGREADPDGTPSYDPAVSPYADMVRLEIVCAEDRAEEWARAVAEAARTGRRGDGKVFVLPVERGIDIRTQQATDDAGV
jgi:nitrogen regulatory protein PII